MLLQWSAGVGMLLFNVGVFVSPVLTMMGLIVFTPCACHALRSLAS